MIKAYIKDIKMGDSVTNTAAKAVTKTTSSAQPGEMNYIRNNDP